MSKLLLSINPEHVENILQGTKKYEFRKVGSRRPVDRIVIYSTAPVSMIVGEVEVVDALGGSPAEIWQQTAEHSGISKEFFDSYFKGKSKAIAYRLGEVRKYKRPKHLADVGVSSAPQSFAYLPSCSAVIRSSPC
jgi:predicted transcriptional regulator